MFNTVDIPVDKDDLYQQLLIQVEAIIEDRLPLVSNLSNISALLNYYLSDINWVGFYLYNDQELYLGPFQGLPACTRIKLDRGVCGACATLKETQIVDDVNLFVNHIACDSNSLSEIVIPITKDNILYGVLDIDSPILSRFDRKDQYYLEKLIKIIIRLFQ